MPAAEPAAAPIGADEADRLFARLEGAGKLAVAVSGGADSTALMLLMARWQKARPGRPEIAVFTVDHGLRAGSAAEARRVAGWAKALGLVHRTLAWRGEKPAGDIQAEARAARYRLLAEACHGARIDMLVTAHHLEDQAETVLLRLVRGSGVDGLSAMDALGEVMGIALARPFLDVARARLAATLVEAGHGFIEDPSNDDTRFARVRLRKLMPALAGEGLTPARLAATARNMRRARQALDAATDQLARACARLDRAGGCTLDRAALMAAPAEIGLRLLARALMAAGGTVYRPRLERLERIYGQIGEAGSGRFTLAGCRIAVTGDSVAIWREAGRAGLPQMDLRRGATALWDGRIRVSAAAGAPARVSVRALGEDGWRVLKGLGRAPELPGQAARVSASFWRDGELLAAPAAAPWLDPGGRFAAEPVARLEAADGPR